MSEENALRQEEKAVAALAHGSVLLGFFTSGIGGLIVALVVWLVEKEKSAYAAGQALQALAYQALTFVVSMVLWCCWGVVWMILILAPLTANPGAYETTPPAGLWVGLALMVIPLGVWALIVAYGLYGAVRCLGGHDFRYLLIGNWLKSQ